MSWTANPYVNNVIFIHESKMPQFYNSVRKISFIPSRLSWI
jgi:hypothetical protein